MPDITVEVVTVEVLESPTNEVEVTTPGPQGGQGPAGTIAVGTVTTVAPTDPATVTNVGTANAAILDFEIPQGEKGDQGDPGADGADGLGLYFGSPHNVTDGQSATALTGELTDSATYDQVDYVARIKRGTTVFARQEFSIFFRNGSWELVLGENRFFATLHGVTFTVHATTGQISAALDVGAGNGTVTLERIPWAA